MDIQLKLISNLILKLNEHMKIINDIVIEINNVINENKVINLNIRNSLHSISETTKKISTNNYNNINLNTSLDISDKDENNFINIYSNKKTVTFKKFGKEDSFLYDSITPLNKIIKNYLIDSGSLRMPKKPIFLYKGCSLNPNDTRKIGDITKDNLEINVDYF